MFLSISISFNTSQTQEHVSGANTELSNIKPLKNTDINEQRDGKQNKKSNPAKMAHWSSKRHQSLSQSQEGKKIKSFKN